MIGKRFVDHNPAYFMRYVQMAYIIVEVNYTKILK
jgi:hypothetical protein